MSLPNAAACAVIPACNEAAHIADIVARARRFVAAVLVVDDGSVDDSAQLAAAAGATILRHSRNLGKGAALQAGLDWAVQKGFAFAITLDGDGQHLPEEMPDFLAVAADCDLAIGNRMAARCGMPWLRWYTNRLMSAIISHLAGVAIPDTQCGFRLIRCAIWPRLVIRSRNFDYESEMLVAAGRLGLRIVSVPISTVYGAEKSKIRPAQDTIRFLQLVWRLWRQPPSAPAP
ncbi:MAG: glycosyltransferase family 2 protein [Planctomycetota bacterium]|nr:glycosyltransferase family 2 protein [Planctomycetota bacterium]